MNIKTELKNFIEHYGWDETLDAIEEISIDRGEEVEIKKLINSQDI